MRKKLGMMALSLCLLALGGCADEPLYDVNGSTEVISFEDFVSSGPVSEEEKDIQYKEYLLQFCQDVLKELEGVEDIKLAFGDETEDLKVKVQVAFEEAVGDKDALKEKIEKALKKFFDKENPLFEIEEVQ